jgi:hypothetical protein
MRQQEKHARVEGDRGFPDVLSGGSDKQRAHAWCDIKGLASSTWQNSALIINRVLDPLLPSLLQSYRYYCRPSTCLLP